MNRWNQEAIIKETYSIADARRIAENNGSHFFDRGTMKFFSSRIESVLYNGAAYCFITSEKMSFTTSSERRYTLRQFNPEAGNIESVGGFCRYATIDEARQAARYFSKHGKEEPKYI